MNNEEKILESIAAIQSTQAIMQTTLTTMQTDISELKNTVGSLESRSEEIQADLGIIKAVQNRHSFHLEKIVRFVDLQSKVSVSLDERITQLERLAGVI
jgi:hypothetical protein